MAAPLNGDEPFLPDSLHREYTISCSGDFGILNGMDHLAHRFRITMTDDEDSGAGGGLEGDLAVQEAKPKLKKPPLYKVILLNDDYTPMEFVVEVLEIFFRMNREQATHVMLTVHTQGKGVCGIYTRDIAETKMNQVNQYSREHQHPLLCEVEASDG